MSCEGFRMNIDQIHTYIYKFLELEAGEKNAICF